MADPGAEGRFFVFPSRWDSAGHGGTAWDMGAVQNGSWRDMADPGTARDAAGHACLN